MQNAPGFKKGSRLVVTDPKDVPVALAARYQLYRPEPVTLAQGDLLRFTGTVGTKDGKHKLRNGDVHTVDGVTPDGDLRLGNGWVVAKDAGHFRRGFVETSFGAQGRTVDRVLVGMSTRSLPAIDRETMYVASSRGRERMTLYTDDKDAVREAIHDTSAKAVALDLAEGKERRKAMLDKFHERMRHAQYYQRLREAWNRPAERQQQRQADRGMDHGR
jgi:hypothetical protein